MAAENKNSVLKLRESVAKVVAYLQKKNEPLYPLLRDLEMVDPTAENGPRSTRVTDVARGCMWEPDWSLCFGQSSYMEQGDVMSIWDKLCCHAKIDFPAMIRRGFPEKEVEEMKYLAGIREHVATAICVALNKALDKYRKDHNDFEDMQFGFDSMSMY
jgi:hypothetical protein